MKNSFVNKIKDAYKAIKNNEATILGFIVVFGSLYLIYNVRDYTSNPILIILWVLFHLTNIYVYFKYNSLLEETKKKNDKNDDEHTEL